jgi:hypothetical protein
VSGRGSGSTEKRMISDIYHDDQGEKRNPMGEVENKGFGKGGWVYGKKVLEVIGITMIKVKRGIQWDMH